MNYTIHDYNIDFNEIDIIKNWITSFYSKKNYKPLFLYGDPFIGKTTLSNIILKNYRVIVFDYTNINEINNYLSKKDISIMFKKTQKKAIIFDNIDNSCISNIINTVDKYNYPIIITSNSILSSKIQKLLKHCHLIKLNKFLNINNRDLFIEDTLLLSTYITKNYKINDLCLLYYNRYNTVILNILDYIFNKIDKNDLLKIYDSVILSEVYNNFKIKNNIIDTQYSILYSILIPRFYLIKNNICISNIKYNKYTSKSIIVPQMKTIYNNNYDIYIFLVMLLNNKYLLNFKNYYIEYKCDIKLLKYYIRINKLINNINIQKKIIDTIIK